MASTSTEETPTEAPQISFKVKTSSDGNHSITMSQAATVLDLKTKLSGDDYEKIPVDRMRLIYSGRVMKDAEPLSTYKIKAGNTIHMVKSAASNASQNPAAASTSATGSAPAVAGVPTNMAAGTQNDPLAAFTSARYAGMGLHLPGMAEFGADGGMGAPPNEEDMATMLDDPNIQQTLNEALDNPAMIDMMIRSVPGLANNPMAREMLRSPEFRRMMTNPDAIRQASAMRRMMGGDQGGPTAFPAPGATATTPSGAAASSTNPNPPANPWGALPGAAGAAGAAGANPFAALFGLPSQTPVQTPPAPRSTGQASPSINTPAVNPFASLFGAPPAAGGAAGPSLFPGMPPMTPEMMQQAMQMVQSGQFNDIFGGANPLGALGAGLGGASSPPPPADTRPPEERYADQLRQLNDMGFYDFDRNIQALRRSGGSVQGAIEHLLS